MTVYVVEWHSMGYESGLSAVFSTEAKARAWVEVAEKSKRERFEDGYWIYEFEVDPPLLK